MCGLGRALAARGHDVAVGANPSFGSMVRRARLTMVPIGTATDYERLVASPALMDGTRGFGAVMRHATTLLAPIYDAIAAHRPDRIGAHPLAFAAEAAQEKLGIPSTTVFLSPALLGSAHQPPVHLGVPNSALMPRWYKRSVLWVTERLILDAAVARPIDAFRASIGLAPAGHAFGRSGPSLALFPPWFAARQPDWPERLALTTFPLCDDDDGRFDPKLDEFLDAGSPPIVVTAGTAQRHAARLFAAATEAATILGQRAVLVTRHTEQLPSYLPPEVRHVYAAPLGRLLRRASALIHHGGIGTAAAALAAGVPQIVTPFAHDQPDNAARLVRLGVGETLAPRGAGAAKLAAALTRAFAPERLAACRDWAQQLARTSLDDAARIFDETAAEKEPTCRAS
jgi:UDP:flavonoid glycosyltransferase YjiC (YdhE family)